MADLILPDSRFEMPSLYYHGRKPVGNVKVDWSNSITDKLKLFILPNAHHSKHLVQEWTADKWGTLGLKVRGAVGQDVAGASGTSTDCGWKLHDGGSAASIFNSNFSFVFDFVATGTYDADGRNTFIDTRDSSYTIGHLLFLTDGGTSVSYLVDKGSTTESLKITNVIVIGQRHRLVLSKNEVTGDVIIALDGKVIGQQTFTTGTWQAEQSGVAFMRRFIWSTSRGTSLDNFKGIAFCLQGYARDLSESEAVSLSSNPYQFLIPA